MQAGGNMPLTVEFSPMAGAITPAAACLRGIGFHFTSKAVKVWLVPSNIHPRTPFSDTIQSSSMYATTLRSSTNFCFVKEDVHSLHLLQFPHHAGSKRSRRTETHSQ